MVGFCLGAVACSDDDKDKPVYSPDGSIVYRDASTPATNIDAGTFGLDAAADAAPTTDFIGADGGLLAKGPKGFETNAFPHDRGNAANGKAVFRSETFGNEGFWTDVVKLPQGLVAAGFTPVMALKAGFNIDVEKLDATTLAAVAKELKTDLSPANAPVLNNPATTVALINANAVVGVVAKDSNGDGKIAVEGGADKVGVACAMCHATTDGSAFALPMGGTIGKVIDGPAPHTLNVGATFALAANTLALYPIAQLALDANGGKSIGRAPAGLNESPSHPLTEAEIDAYFNNPAYYPVGMFDDQPDGTGAPMHVTPMFAAALSAPYGSEGTIAKLDNFSNLVYTALLDQRNLIQAGGRAFLHLLGGAAGDEIADDYAAILARTGVPTTPTVVGAAATPGQEASPVGIRLDQTKLLDLSAFMDDLPAPAGKPGDPASIARGIKLFEQNCTSCHNVDQKHFVPSQLIAMKTIFPGDNPVDLGARTPPLNDLLNTVDSIFDDKMVVVNASLRMDIRGIALPLLLDLDRKPVFLHDNSVPTLDALFDAARGPSAPHAVYLTGQDKTDVIAFLRSN